MAELTERERITLLMMRGWGELQRGYKAVRQLFNANFRGRNNAISKTTVIRTIQRFEDTGSVKDRPRSGRSKTATNEDKSLEVLQSFVEDPHTSINRVSQENEISFGSVHKILKLNKWHPFKMSLVHELSEDDYDRRMEFCETLMAMIIENPELLDNIVFSDEATFELTGNVNRHNLRYWSSDNPHWMRENHTQYPQKINVWAGIFRGQPVGPFFIEGNLTAAIYETLLREQVIPEIQRLADGNVEDVFFQQDGAPPHYGLNVRRYLTEIFQDRWIGRRGGIEWPARSPDLTPLDFFLWGYLKDKVYVTKPTDLADLRRRIEYEMQMIPPETYRNAVRGVYHRLAHCQAVNGQQFEHLL